MNHEKTTDYSTGNRFLLSSTSFSPSTFLSEVHKDASTEQLLQGLHHLSQSIEQKSASLKLLVESNFERFVRAKTTIDNVYTEMKNHGQDNDSDQYGGTRSSLASRMATTRKMNDGSLNGYARYQDHYSNQDKRKNALVKESDYGTQGIKLPLVDATVKAEEVWGPALGGHEREETLKALLASFEKNRAVLEVEAAIEDCIKRHDYEALSKEYARAQRFANDARVLANEDQTRGDESRIYQIILTSRMWADVQERLGLFKQEAWRKLMETATTERLPRDARKTNDVADLTSILLQIGVDDSPIFSWLTKRREHLQKRIINSFERSRVELEIYRRRLSNGSDVTKVQLASHLRVTVSPSTAETDSVHLDRVQVIQFWHHLQTSLEHLLSPTDGILGEVIEYYETAHSFINGPKLQGIPDETSEQSQSYRQLSGEEVRDVQKGILDLCAYIQSQVHTLFTQAPDEDMSTLLSPTSPVSRVPQSAGILAKEMQTPLSKSGKEWDLLSYWPPYSNCRSAAYFLRAIMNQVCNAAIEMTSLHVVKQDASLMQMLRGSISDIREGIITAVTTAWVYDSGRCGDLEDWVRPVDKTDVTNMPNHLRTFEASMISDLQQIAYVPEIMNAPGSRDIVKPPSPAQLETIQQAFLGSLFKAFGCIVEHTSQAATSDRGNDLMAISDVKASLQHSHGTPIDASDIVSLVYMHYAETPLTKRSPECTQTSHNGKLRGSPHRRHPHVMRSVRSGIFSPYARRCAGSARLPRRHVCAHLPVLRQARGGAPARANRCGCCRTLVRCWRCTTARRAAVHIRGAAGAGARARRDATDLTVGTRRGARSPPRVRVTGAHRRLWAAGPLRPTGARAGDA